MKQGEILPLETLDVVEINGLQINGEIALHRTFALKSNPKTKNSVKAQDFILIRRMNGGKRVIGQIL